MVIIGSSLSSHIYIMLHTQLPTSVACNQGIRQQDGTLVVAHSYHFSYLPSHRPTVVGGVEGKLNFIDYFLPFCNVSDLIGHPRNFEVSCGYLAEAGERCGSNRSFRKVWRFWRVNFLTSGFSSAPTGDMLFPPWAGPYSGPPPGGPCREGSGRP